MEQQLKNIAQQFAIEGEIADIRPLGNGLINTTYAVTTTGSTPDYVLQNVKGQQRAPNSLQFVFITYAPIRWETRGGF